MLVALYPRSCLETVGRVAKCARAESNVVAGERPTEVVGSESGVALSVLCGSGSQMSGIILGLTALRTFDVSCCKAPRHLWRTARPRV